MNKLLATRGEEGLELLADILGPVTVIFNDGKFKELTKKGDKLSAVQYVLKYYPGDVLYVMAKANGMDQSEYNPNPVELISDVLKFLNDPDMANFFALQGWIDSNGASGSATENTGEADNQ